MNVEVILDNKSVEIFFHNGETVMNEIVPYKTLHHVLGPRVGRFQVKEPRNKSNKWSFTAGEIE